MSRRLTSARRHASSRYLILSYYSSYYNNSYDSSNIKVNIVVRIMGYITVGIIFHLLFHISQGSGSPSNQSAKQPGWPEAYPWWRSRDA